jgi:hypothetical protein
MIYKFSEVERLMKAADFRHDEIGIDRRMIESYSCRRCRAYLEYKAYSNAYDTLEFGVCRQCNTARHFFTNSQLLAELKQRFSRREMVAETGK